MRYLKTLSAMLLLLSAAACFQAPWPTTPPVTSPVAPRPVPGNPGALGLLELTFDALGTPRPTVTVSDYDLSDDSLEAQRLSPRTSDMIAVRQVFLGLGEEVGADHRFLVATFEVTNTSAMPLPNLTFMGVNLPEFVGETAIRNALLANGQPADAMVVQAITPSHGMTSSGSALVVRPDHADFVAYGEYELTGETLAAAASFGVRSVFPFGFVTRKFGLNDRVLNPGETGLVTVSFRVPRVNDPELDLLRFSFIALVTTDSETRVTQSPQESFEATLRRARDVNASIITTFGQGERNVSQAMLAELAPYDPRGLVTGFWDVRTAGIDPRAPLVTMASQIPEVVAGHPRLTAFREPRGGHDWRNERIYFVMTDRFLNADPSNDNGFARPGAADEGTTEAQNPLGWHGGDFAGLRQAIEDGYFQGMGFTALWLTPVYLQVPSIEVGSGPNQGQPFAGYHGYWADSFFYPDPHLGTLQEYRDLIRVAQANGLRVVQDMVVNHTGYGALLEHRRPDWFHTQADCDAAPPALKDKACDLAGLPDLDQRIPEVTQYLNNTVEYWVQHFGIDGIRMDTVKHVYDAYWLQYTAPGGPGDPAVVWTVGEVFDGSPSRMAFFMDSLGLPSVFDFPLYFRIKDHLSSPGGNLDEIAGIFAQDTVYSDPSRLTTFIDNHDVPLFVSEALNRGVPAAAAVERLDMALSLIYTARGKPSVYYGTEIARPGGGDPFNFPSFGGNRVPMDFAAVVTSPIPARLAALSSARNLYPSLTHGVQQELWRPSGGAAIYAFRRTLEGQAPVVVVMNNSDAAIDLSTLGGGGIPLIGTFAADAPLTEVTARPHGLTVDAQSRLVGIMPPRSLVALSAPGGEGGGENPALPHITGLMVTPGDAAARLRWDAPADPAVAGYRVYFRQAGAASFTQLNFAPFPVGQLEAIVRGLANETLYEFSVRAVDAAGREAPADTAPSVTATPSAANVTLVTFMVDAQSQGAGQLQLRRFDTGSEQRIPMTPTPERGLWTVQLELPLFREIRFKFGNAAAGAKNQGYEGPGQSDRVFVVDTGASFFGFYDFITQPRPDAMVTGTVSAGGTPLERALVESSTDPNLHYAFTFADGSYILMMPSGAADLTATAVGFGSETRGVIAPATGVNFDFAPATGLKYVINGNIDDWTPRAVLDSPQEGGFGPSNNFMQLLVDWDETHLYVAYRYRASGNRAIVYMDTGAGGFMTARGLNAWPQLADFTANGINFFMAQQESAPLQLWAHAGGATVTQVAADAFVAATAGDAISLISEVAIPWETLGLSGMGGMGLEPLAVPEANLGFFAGIFGGNNFGAGDIAPDANSIPAGNNFFNSGDSFTVTFNEAFVVGVAPEPGQPKYIIDGNLDGWTPRATLSSPDEGLWGPNNNFQELLVDWDATFLYLGYRYRADGNSSILYLDSATGGAVTASGFNAWPRRADFNAGINVFFAQFQDQALQVWRVETDTFVTQVPGDSFVSATVGSFPAFTTELAIPWTSLGDAPPNDVLGFYGGIFGGDNFGSGEIVPNATSIPAAPGNSSDPGDSFNARFTTPFAVPR